MRHNPSKSSGATAPTRRAKNNPPPRITSPALSPPRFGHPLNDALFVAVGGLLLQHNASLPCYADFVSFLASHSATDILAAFGRGETRLAFGAGGLLYSRLVTPELVADLACLEIDLQSIARLMRQKLADGEG
ncbi:MAG: hypothetical protein AB7O62_08525 [Pirellulales bacterium]